jgi:hypothetical protein
VTDWSALLDGDEVPALELAERLADAEGLDVRDAQDRVYAALGDALEEEGDGHGFVTLAGSDDADGDEDDADAAQRPPADTWGDVSFSDTEAGVWPPAHRSLPAWMLRKGGKAPWAPWADADAPVECQKRHNGRSAPVTCAKCRHSAKYKWGSAGSAEHVHTDYETALEWRDHHPQASSDLVFIQSDADPFGFVDGDDVRDPETGNVHPEFVRILDALGVSYADVSTSGAGVHVMYRGELPDRVKQATFQIDDGAFGANDEGDLPAVEIYDGKHVCVATGDHVVGTGTEVREWDADGLRDVLDEYDQLRTHTPSADHEDFDAENYDADATTSEETTTEIRDLFAAIDSLNAQRVAEKTIVRRWNDSVSTSDGERAFYPTFGESGDGRANIASRDRWLDTGDRGGYGGPVVMAAIDAGLVSDKDCPDAVRGETWFKAVDHLRSLGFDIPRLVDETETPTAEDLGLGGEADSAEEAAQNVLAMMELQD